MLDLDSKEERGGKSLSNSAEAHLVVHLYSFLKEVASFQNLGRIAVITPYSQQAGLLKRLFSNLLGSNYSKIVEVNTVDAFQGREGMLKSAFTIIRITSILTFFEQQILSFFLQFVQQVVME